MSQGRRSAVASVAVLCALVLCAAALAACGSGGSTTNEAGLPEEPPADFALTFHYVAGSVPPPYHDEYTIEANAAGAGNIEFVPDYPGEEVPVFRKGFDVEPGSIDEIWETLRSQDLLRDYPPEGDVPVGGAITSAEISADGERYSVPEFADGEAPFDDATVKQFRELVPASVWDAIRARHEAYAKANYDEPLP